jgi:hypothetical protein
MVLVKSFNKVMSVLLPSKLLIGIKNVIKISIRKYKSLNVSMTTV